MTRVLQAMERFTMAMNSAGKWWLNRAGLIAAAAMIAVGGASFGLRAQPAAPAKPAPAKTAPAAAPAPAAPAEKETIKGVIRHGVPEAIAKPEGVVRVANYNIENLFGVGADGKMGDAGRGTTPKPAEHQQAAADAIKKLNADVIALQEIQSLEVLTKFRDTYLADMGYEHIVSVDAGDDRGIEQSVLSKYPIVETKQWLRLPLGGTHNANRTESDRVAGGPIEFKRSPLMVKVELPKAKDAPADAKAQTLTLFVVHFKSGGRKDNYWREREAAKTAELAKDVEKANPETAVIVCGDFNARPQEKAFKNVAAAGFVDAFGDLPDGDPKYISHSSDRVIDHVMLSKRAMAGLVKETRFVLGTMNRPAGVDWRTTPTPAGYASDHYPVVIDLDLKKMMEWKPEAEKDATAK